MGLWEADTDLGDIGPAVAQLTMQSNQSSLFFHGPFFLINVRTQLVVPPLAQLLPNAPRKQGHQAGPAALTKLFHSPATTKERMQLQGIAHKVDFQSACRRPARGNNPTKQVLPSNFERHNNACRGTRDQAGTDKLGGFACLVTGYIGSTDHRWSGCHSYYVARKGKLEIHRWPN